MSSWRGVRSLAGPSRLASTLPPRPRVIFSGIQPTGIPHLGNYLGALSNWVDLQNNADADDSLFFSVVGLHALTLPQHPKTLLQERRDMMATLLAIGLSPERCTIFHQDQVGQHAELAWLLNCITPFGKLSRMTTWKAKLATARNGLEEDVDQSHLALGLFAYPVLQAADILLYRATHVPVGEDQVQHLELSRDLADLFNRTFKKRFFPLPRHIITPTKRILSLRDPKSKMSKSAPDMNSRILLTDTPIQIERKVRKAVTDAEKMLSFDPENRPGISNLLSILNALAPNDESPNALAERLNGEFERAGGSPAMYLKEKVTEAVVEMLRPVQVELERLRNEEGYLQGMEALGRQKAQAVAEENMQSVRKLVGLA